MMEGFLLRCSERDGQIQLEDPEALHGTGVTGRPVTGSLMGI